jgi:FkbM family methyltransferase
MSKTARAVSMEEISARRLRTTQPFGQFAANRLQSALIGLARATPLRRGMFRGPLARLIMRLTGTPLDINFRACAYRLHNNSNLIEYGLMLVPEYNAADIDFLIEGAAPGSNFVDIGSNIGLYALPCAKAAGRDGVLIAIDANPQMAQALAWNASASGLANVRMFACAVSDNDGHGDLMIRKDDVAIVSLVESADGSVQVRTLASIIAEAGITSIRGLKIDIEGHEDKALVPFLNGAPQALLPKRIVIEHPAPDDDYPGCKAVFALRGYRLTGRSRNNSFYLLEEKP